MKDLTIVVTLSIYLGLVACGGSSGGDNRDRNKSNAPSSEESKVDTGEAGAGDADSGGVDVGVNDSGETDSGETDSGETDSGETDSGETDSGETDSGETDSGETDSGETDSGETDSGETDSGETDSGETDTDGTEGGETELPAGFTPYFSDNFEAYADGESLSNNNPFDSAGRTVASREQSYSGSTSAKMEIREGDKGGFGRWGGIIPITPNLEKGREVWVRMRVYWPQEFEFSAHPWMKFIRLHNKTSQGTNGGHNDLYIDEADKTKSVLRCIKEQHDHWQVYDGSPIPRNHWETYEIYLFVDELSVDEGGQARMRIWRDTELIFDRTDVPTITEAGGVIDYLYIFTYWNNETPPNNVVYLDDLVIATDQSPPNQIDEQGNVFIGDLKQ